MNQVDEANASTAAATAVAALRLPWAGPYGGLPPYENATPAAIEQALLAAIECKRAAFRAIVENTADPSFDNTVAALERCSRELRDIYSLASAVAQTASNSEIGSLMQRMTPMVSDLELEIAQDRHFFQRVECVWESRKSSGLDQQQIRLLEVLHIRLQRAGVCLSDQGRTRLREIGVRLAALSSQFSRNLLQEQNEQITWLEEESDLAGLPEVQREAAARAAAERGRPGVWAIPNQRPAVWPFLTHSTRREWRERVWRLWDRRGANEGPNDNRPLIREMLRLRGERARLMGYPSHAHAMLADRMAGSPETAMAAMLKTWKVVRRATTQHVADLQALANEEGADTELAPWDRLHYSEKLRRRRFNFDLETIAPYLSLERISQALFWSAQCMHGLSFRELHGVEVLHPSIRVFEVSRSDEVVGVLYLDLFQRPGKMHGSHQHRIRAAETFDGRVLPISNVVSGLPVPEPGKPALLAWEYANVLFHEFGHALHMLMDGARYPSLGSLAVAWDMVELPSLLHEYWLRDRELLRRFARHHESNEPIPEDLLDKLEASLKADRIFSVNLDYLGSAVVDLKLHLMATDETVDINAEAVERETLDELGMPTCWDLILCVANSVHSFGGKYDAGLYSYLWSDMMAADVVESLAAAPLGLADSTFAQRWREAILTAGHLRPAGEAFRKLMSRDPDPVALLRRFALA